MKKIFVILSIFTTMSFAQGFDYWAFTDKLEATIDKGGIKAGATQAYNVCNKGNFDYSEDSNDQYYKEMICYFALHLGICVMDAKNCAMASSAMYNLSDGNFFIHGLAFAIAKDGCDRGDKNSCDQWKKLPPIGGE